MSTRPIVVIILVGLIGLVALVAYQLEFEAVEFFDLRRGDGTRSSFDKKTNTTNAGSLAATSFRNTLNATEEYSTTVNITGTRSEGNHTTTAPAGLKSPPEAKNETTQEITNAPTPSPIVDGEVIVDPSYPRVIVVATWFRYPSLMRLQVASLRTYLKRSSMEYVAVLNARTRQENKVFSTVARQLGVSTFAVKNRRSKPSYNHAFALNAIYTHLLHGNGTVQLRPGIDALFIIDTDMFLMAPFDVSNLSLWTFIQERKGFDDLTVRYLWPNLVVAQLNTTNMTTYDELNFAHCWYRNANMDSGGCTARFIDIHSEIPLTGVKRIECNISETDTPACRFFEEQFNATGSRPEHCTYPALFDDTIYHLGSAGSNYRNCPEDFLKNRRQDIHHFFQRTLSNETIQKNLLYLDVE